MQKIILTLAAWMIVVEVMAVSFPVDKFISIDELKKQWVLTHDGRFMSCQNGELEIVDSDPPIYRCISWQNKKLELKNYVFRVEITVLNNKEEWTGVNIDGINFLIRHNGFNYTYCLDGETTGINKVIPEKIAVNQPYLFEITRIFDGDKAEICWRVNGKPIADFSYCGKVKSSGSLRLGCWGMGARFRQFEFAEPSADLSQKQSAVGIAGPAVRDMTLENTARDAVIDKNKDVRAQKPQEVLAQKKKLGFKKFPIGAYTDCLRLSSPEVRQIFEDEKEFKDWEDIGFSLMFSPAFNSADPVQKEAMSKLLTMAGKYDLKILLTDRNFFNKSRQDIPIEAFRREIKNMGEFFSGFDAFAGFVIADEPTDKSLQRSLDFVKVHREVLPGKLPFINFGFEPVAVGKSSWDDFFSSVIKDGQLEVLSYDFYGQMLDREKLSSYYFMVLENLRASSLKNGVPFWFIGLVTPHLYFIEPTFNDLRWQFNTALAYGASGYFWWFYYDERHDINANYRKSPIDWNGDKTESYYNLKRVQQKFRHQYGDLFNRLASVRVTHYPDKIVVGEKWTPNEFLAGIEIDVRSKKNDMEHQLLIGEFVDQSDCRYLMFVNNNRVDNIALKLKFPSNAVLYHYEYGEEKSGFSREYGIGKHWLAPGQELVYRIELK